ncbi:GtrA family protein [Helicobacter sp. 23-1044]
MREIFKPFFSKYFGKYLLVGVANTIFGFGVIFALMFCEAMPEIANFLGYICGIILSYFLNKNFTFESKNSHRHDFWRFCVAMGGAYLINLIALIIAHRAFFIDKYTAQIIAGIAYTLSGYVLNKFFVFR